jgi:hypothetical protein
LSVILIHQRFEPFLFFGYFPGLLIYKQCHDGFSDDIKVFSSVVFPFSGLVFSKYHVQGPMKIILNGPVASCILVDLLRAGFELLSKCVA